MSVKRRRPALLALVLGLVALAAAGTARADAPTVTNGTVTSKAPDHIQIAYTLYKPFDASPTHKVPFIIHSHGWGGSRTSSPTAFGGFIAADFGVLSFDQRGWGQSGGQANVEDPELEGYDIETLVDFIGNLDWVQTDGPDDPVLGAIGGSYGGGYQTIGALSEILHHGSTRFNALAPEITWFDLPESLAPQGVSRTVWGTVLYAAGASHVPNFIHESFAYAAATGQFADGTVDGLPNLKQIFYEHSPRWFADHGYKLNIPVLFGQGITDNLFTLNQGWHNLTDVLTPAAQANSYLVGYNAGHVLPDEFPVMTQPGSTFGVGGANGDTCSGPGGFGALSVGFFKKVFAGEDLSGFLPARFNLSANDGTSCIHTDSLDDYTNMSAGVGGVIATTSGVGAPVAYQLAEGPITVAGIPKLSGTLTAAVADVRAFFALAVGTTPADAKVIQNNMLPLRSLLPAVQQPFSIELPGVAIDIPAGQNLYLMVSPVDSLYGINRIPGAILIQDATVGVPTA